MRVVADVRLQINDVPLTLGDMERWLRLLRLAGADDTTPVQGIRQNDSSMWLRCLVDVEE